MSIYETHPEAYDRMVAAEDCDHNLLPALNALCPLVGLDVVEVGVGTGRVTALMHQGGARALRGVEPAAPMLALARVRAAAWGADWAQLEQAAGDALPFPDRCADLAIAGWVFGHMPHWHPDTWQSELAACLREFERVTRPSSTWIILETLGTGARQPAPPDPRLAAYYAHLEDTHGFTRTVVATDYQFDSVDAAAEACGFFFGAAFAETIRAEGWSRVPEWTGIWWRRHTRTPA